MKYRPLGLGDSVHFGMPAFPEGVNGWVLADPHPIGYIAFAQVSGLPHIADLYGYVFPPRRRRGYGSTLLSHILDVLKDSPIEQISTPVENLESATAYFLRDFGFYQSHTEIDLNICHFEHIPRPNCQLKTVDRIDSVGLLRSLYEKSFREHPWYQPFISDEEVDIDLGPQSDIFYLFDNDEPVAFAGVKYQEDGIADIEPLGVVPAAQGQGIGRMFITALLHQLADQGNREIQLTVWEENEVARHVYGGLGFQEVRRLHYLAYDIL